MLRPPRNQGETAWMDRATELRSKATQLAKTLSLKDYAASRAEFVNLANTCNRCHQTFRVPVVIEPFSDQTAQ
jgi:cytochrome c556